MIYKTLFELFTCYAYSFTSEDRITVPPYNGTCEDSHGKDMCIYRHNLIHCIPKDNLQNKFKFGEKEEDIMLNENVYNASKLRKNTHCHKSSCFVPLGARTACVI